MKKQFALILVIVAGFNEISVLFSNLKERKEFIVNQIFDTVFGVVFNNRLKWSTLSCDFSEVMFFENNDCSPDSSHSYINNNWYCSDFLSLSLLRVNYYKRITEIFEYRIPVLEEISTYYS